MGTHRQPGTLIILCGLPGSGKTTLAAGLVEQRGAITMSADMWMGALGVNLHDEPYRDRVEKLQWQVTQQLLALGITVVIEWGTWGRPERDALRIGARALGARVELVYLHAPVDVLFARVQRRGMEDPPLTYDQLAYNAGRIQVPTEEEGRLFDAYRSIGEDGLHAT